MQNKINLREMISNTIRQGKLLFILLLMTLCSSAQKNTGLFHISGRIKIDNGDPVGAVVSLTNLTTKSNENTATINSTGKFEFDLKYFSEYRLTVVKENHYTKDIDVSTVIPSKVWAKDSIFPPFLMGVLLYKKVPGVTLSFEGKVVGKLCYSPKGKLDNFDSDIYIDDKDIRKEIDQALKEHADEIFNLKMAEAVEYEKKNQIREAIHAYEEALDLRKNDPYIKPKIKELLSDLKNLEKDAMLEAEFNRLLLAGDENVANLKFPEAIDNFKAALSIKQGNRVASDKLTNAEQLLAKVNAEKAKLDAEFNRLLAEGDANVSGKKYPEAIGNYKSALAIKADSPVALAKLSKAEQLLANSNADKAKLEAEYTRLLAAGDANVSGQKYPEAIGNFKDALSIKNGDKVASDKLANAEQLLARLNADKAARDAEFNRLLAAGDANVSGKKYPEAIDNFKSALVIRVADPIASAKLAKTEQLLANANADKAKLEAEFSRLLAEGDVNVSGQKFNEAIANFKSALTIKNGDKIASDKLANAEQLLARLNADKAAQAAEFTRLVAAGDANVTSKKYTEAIDNYKGALAIRPADPAATTKLENAMKLLAGVNAENARLEAEFTRLLAAGDLSVSGQKYLEAINSFQKALAIKTGDPVATAKLTNAEQLLARLNADKAKQEAEYNRLLAAGDANVSGQKYPEAIGNFKDALGIKSGDKIASDKLTNAEQLLAKLNAGKAMQEAEFNRLLATGDANVLGQKYPEAIDNFKRALQIKAGDKIASDKLANAEKLLTGLNALLAQQEAEFTRLVTVGDNNVSNQKFPEAIDNFKGALAIKKGDRNATAKLANAEQLLARANAEKTRVEAEFNRLLAVGDANVTDRRYPEAIGSYKSALQIKAGDKIASDKLAIAEQLLERANAEKVKLEEEFKRLLAAGDANISLQKFPEGIANFKDALKLKVGDPIATNKLTEAEKMLALLNAEKLRKETEQRLLAEKEKKYRDLIAKADKLFGDKAYVNSRDQYKEAIRISDAERYPHDRIVVIDSLLAQIARERLLAQKLADEQRKLQGEGSYLKNIQTADANYAKSLWTVAIFYYQEALKFKAADKYALGKVDDCRKMIDSNITAERMNEYNSFVKQADDDLKAKKYSSARFYYGKASEILSWEIYPREQLKVVEKAISLLDINGVEGQYFEAIKKAEEAVTLKNYAIARFYFQKAISLKPDEDYPKQQLKRLSSEK